MKHTPSITTILVLLFVLSQLTGLFLLSQELTVSETDGIISVEYEDTAIGERPETTGAQSLLFLVVGVTAGTLILLVLAKYRLKLIWKGWFFIAVWLCLTIALGAIMATGLATLLALILAVWKIFKTNTFIHNLTEILVYAGISILLVPLFTIGWAILLLVLIALYDAYAVWKSKHMISLAKFQTDTNLFAGLHLNYQPMKQQKTTHVPKKVATTHKTESKSAVLGGGDMTFPLLFTGVVLNWLLLKGIPMQQAIMFSLLIIVGSASSLLFLFYIAKKDRFYPAMPFISTGCFIGLGIIALLI